MTDAKFDVYSHVTEQIIAQIEAGTPPWRKPWTGGAAGTALPMRWNGEAYRGINILILWATASAKGYSSERWMTFKQAQELGGHVRKGEKSSTVVKFGTVEREDENGEERQVPYARAYRVFNADQIEGLAADFYLLPDPPRDRGTVADPELEAFFCGDRRADRQHRGAARLLQPDNRPHPHATDFYISPRSRLLRHLGA